MRVWICVYISMCIHWFVCMCGCLCVRVRVGVCMNITYVWICAYWCIFILDSHTPTTHPQHTQNTKKHTQTQHTQTHANMHMDTDICVYIHTPTFLYTYIRMFVCMYCFYRQENCRKDRRHPHSCREPLEDPDMSTNKVRSFSLRNF